MRRVEIANRFRSRHGPASGRSKLTDHHSAKHSKESKQGQTEQSGFKDLSTEEAIKRLETSTDGLSQDEVKRRLDQYGYNELPEEKESALLQFLAYFRGTIPYMIMAAAVVSGILANYITLIIILILLFVNAIIGFREERQAGNAIAALKERLAVQAKVKRGGKWTTIQARELVPGDIVRLRIGSVIPADAKLREDGDSV